jgi:hypothetical protein
LLLRQDRRRETVARRPFGTSHARATMIFADIGPLGMGPGRVFGAYGDRERHVRGMVSTGSRARRKPLHNFPHFVWRQPSLARLC